jgi:thiol:disulfide interchange protein
MHLLPSLGRWLLLQAALGLLLGLPLLLAPQWILGALGWSCVDPTTARLCGALLAAMGAHVYLRRSDGPEAIRALVDLNLLVSATAAFGLFVAFGEGAPPAATLPLAAFIVLTGVWFNARVRLRQLAAARDADEDAGEADGEAGPTDPAN